MSKPAYVISPARVINYITAYYGWMKSGSAVFSYECDVPARVVRNWRQGLHGPSADSLITLMAAFPELARDVADEVIRRRAFIEMRRNKRRAQINIALDYLEKRQTVEGRNDSDSNEILPKEVDRR